LVASVHRALLDDYDRLPVRHWCQVPLWTIACQYYYAPRRVTCPAHGVIVEHLPWSCGKRPLTLGMMAFLAMWAQRLSWLETAREVFWSWGQCVVHAVETSPDPIDASQVADWVNGIKANTPRWMDVAALIGRPDTTQTLDDLDAKAKDLDPKLRVLFSDLLGRVRALAVGPEAIPVVRGQELDLIGNAQKLIAENADLSVRLTAAVDRLVAEAETDVSSSSRDALSVQRLSARILLTFAALSLLGSILIVWLYVGRNLIRRLMRLSSGMLAIAEGSHHTPINISGSDEVAEMGRVVEIFRKNTLERDELLAEKAQAADRLEHQVKERTVELAQSVKELRALGDVSAAVNSTIDLQTVLSTIVAKAVQLSGTEAGTIFVFDEESQEFRMRASYGMDEALVAAVGAQHLRMGETVVSRAVLQRRPIQIYDLQDDSTSPVLDIILRAGFRGHLTIPLLAAEQTVGALVVRRKAPGEFPQSTVDLLQTFGAQSVLAIQNARLFHEIEDKSRQLEVASQHKSQFLANMSHELRTPLNAILGYTELIIDGIYGETPEKAQAVLKRVESNGKHLLGLINDVLDLSKIEAGQLKLSLADYSIKDVVYNVVSAVEPLATKKKLNFKVDVRPDMPTAHGDEQKLTQVLLNLTGNAIKFTDAGEVAIKVTAANGSYTVAIQDTGPGISAADQAKLFQQFQQADNSITKTKGGTGLGLAISRKIIELHGGSISVQSSVGQGSTFAFTLPITVERQAMPS
jgi:signal transduction histidine kinase